MRIAFVISTLDFGGAQTMLLRLLKNIDQKDNQIRVFVRESKKNNSIESEINSIGIPIEYLHIGENEKKRVPLLIRKIKAYLAFSKAVKSFNPNIIHTHLELFYSLVWSLLNKTKIVITIHSQPYRIFTRQLKVLLHLLIKRKLLKVVGCAQCISEECKNVFLLKDESVKTIYNPIDLSLYHASFVFGEYFNYVHVGRLEKIKNQSLLIEAFSKVAAIFPDSRLILVGDGPLHKELENQCKTLGIEEKVLFYGNRSDIPDILSKAQAFVMSSDSEACPMSVLEAIASSLPIISTDVGGIKELADGCGILTPKGDVQSLFRAMVEIQRDDKLREKFKKNSRQKSLFYDCEKIANEYYGTYCSMVD